MNSITMIKRVLTEKYVTRCGVSPLQILVCDFADAVWAASRRSQTTALFASIIIRTFQLLF